MELALDHRRNLLCLAFRIEATARRSTFLEVYVSATLRIRQLRRRLPQPAACKAHAAPCRLRCCCPADTRRDPHRIDQLSLWNAIAANHLQDLGFTLTFNACGHCVLSILRREPVPGTFSAIACTLPFSAIAIYAMHVDLSDTYPSLAKYAAAGALALPATVFLSLLFGLAYTRVAGKRVQDEQPSTR